MPPIQHVYIYRDTLGHTADMTLNNEVQESNRNICILHNKYVNNLKLTFYQYLEFTFIL